MTARPAADLFAAVAAWVFDLDNTLYPSRCRLFAQIDRRMAAFISERLGLSLEDARALQKRYYREHGTTLSGLMAVNGIEPEEFLSFVHDIDVAVVEPNPRLAHLLARLPGRKIIFTNGSRRHAENVLARIGIAEHFESIHDIARGNYVPKPSPEAYARLVRDAAIEAPSAAMVDDIARNLEAAHALGMTTVWIRTESDWSAGHAPTSEAHIHHHADDLTEFLAGIVPARL